MEAEQKKDSSFGFKDFWIGVALGCASALVGTMFVKAASVPDGWRWLTLGILSLLVGMSRRWAAAGHDLISLSAGFLIAFGIWVISSWDFNLGIFPTAAGSIGFVLGAIIRALIKPKTAT